METIQLPAGYLCSAEIDQKLPKANLRETKKLLKAHEVAQSFFVGGSIEQLMARAEELNEQEVLFNRDICLIQKDLGELALQKNYLAPDQIEEKLEELFQKITSFPTPNTRHLKNLLSRLGQEWKHLYFAYLYPVAEELNPDSFLDNAFSQMTQRIEELQKKDPQKAHQLKDALGSLVNLSKAAEAVFFGKGESFPQIYDYLPDEVRLHVQRCFFSQYPDTKIENFLSQEGGRRIVAAAIMNALEDRLMTVDLSNL